MSKGKSKTLLSIIGVLLVAILVLTFVPFSVGAVQEYNSALGAIELDYDIEGGVAYTLTLSDDNEEEVEDVNKVIKTIESRLDALGYGVYSVKAIKSLDEDVLDYQIRIETKNTENTAADIAVVARYGEVKFFGGSSANPSEEILTEVNAIKSARYLGVFTDTAGNAYYQTAIEFTAEGYDALHELMHGENEYYVEIKLDEQVLLSGTNPIDESYFTNNTIVVNGANESAARQMALQIASGGLQYKYDISDGVEITSPLGEGVAFKAVVSVAVLVAIIIVALIVSYKGLGIVSALSTLIFIIAEIWMMIAVPGIVVSMGGVIGIALATLLTAIGLILTCARVQEEFAHSEKTVKAALNKGLRQALVPVININVISAIIALTLFALCGGAVKGFAITFGIGVALSTIATLVFTRMFISLILPIVKNKEAFLNVKKSNIKLEENN